MDARKRPWDPHFCTDVLESRLPIQTISILPVGGRGKGLNISRDALVLPNMIVKCSQFIGRGRMRKRLLEARSNKPNNNGMSCKQTDSKLIKSECVKSEAHTNTPDNDTCKQMDSNSIKSECVKSASLLSSHIQSLIKDTTEKQGLVNGLTKQTEKNRKEIESNIIEVSNSLQNMIQADHKQAERKRILTNATNTEASDRIGGIKVSEISASQVSCAQSNTKAVSQYNFNAACTFNTGLHIPIMSSLPTPNYVIHGSTALCFPKVALCSPNTFIHRANTMINVANNVMCSPNAVVVGPQHVVCAPNTVLMPPNTVLGGENDYIAAPKGVVWAPMYVLCTANHMMAARNSGLFAPRAICAPPAPGMLTSAPMPPKPPALPSLQESLKRHTDLQMHLFHEEEQHKSLNPLAGVFEEVSSPPKATENGVKVKVDLQDPPKGKQSREKPSEVIVMPNLVEKETKEHLWQRETKENLWQRETKGNSWQRETKENSSEIQSKLSTFQRGTKEVSLQKERKDYSSEVEPKENLKIESVAEIKVKENLVELQPMEKSPVIQCKTNSPEIQPKENLLQMQHKKNSQEIQPKENSPEIKSKENPSPVPPKETLSEIQPFGKGSNMVEVVDFLVQSVNMEGISRKGDASLTRLYKEKVPTVKPKTFPQLPEKPSQKVKPYVPENLHIEDVIINDRKPAKKLPVTLSVPYVHHMHYNDVGFLKTLDEKELMLVIEHIPLDAMKELEEQIATFGTIVLFISELTNFDRELTGLLKMSDESECDFVVACLDGYVWGDMRMSVKKVEDILST